LIAFLLAQQPARSAALDSRKASKDAVDDWAGPAQVVGKSMEPAIPDGAYCLFRAPVEGTRQGKTVLVQLRDALDPETGQRYTVKQYRSEKAEVDDSWRHTKITLEPLNAEFEAIVLTPDDEVELEVIAELVEVLAT
jgi:SOS-response transcriptional repressor LexA